MSDLRFDQLHDELLRVYKKDTHECYMSGVEESGAQLKEKDKEIEKLKFNWNEAMETHDCLAKENATYSKKLEIALEALKRKCNCTYGSCDICIALLKIKGLDNE